MSEVKRYDAVHIRYEDNNIRYGGGLGVEMVTARDYDALEAECARLKNSLLEITTRHFAERWKQSASEKQLEQYLSAGIAQLETERDALAAENEALVRNLRGKHSLVGATYGHLIRQRDEALAKLAELAEVKGREAVAFYWQDIGYPEPRTHGPYFGQPSESALRNVDGCAMPVPLYTSPQPSPDLRALVSADDVRDACANAVSVFAEETNADQCREVAEYMREVLLAQIAHRQAQPQ